MMMVERGGDSDECNMADARCPHCGKHVCSAAMTEAQKRVGSLSRESRESQAIRDAAPLRFPSSFVSILLCACEERAAHAESSVVFPLPAEAETSVKG
jgi:hypothetical protein